MGKTQNTRPGVFARVTRNAAPTLYRLLLIVSLLLGHLPLAVAPVRAASAADPLPSESNHVPSEAEEPANNPTTFTDAGGYYRFEGLPSGTHRLTIDLATLPLDVRPTQDEAAPVVWISPGMEQTSAALSTGVRFTASYEREDGSIGGVVFVDRDGDGQKEAAEPGVANVLVIDPTAHQYFVPYNDAQLWTIMTQKLECNGATISGRLFSWVFVVSSYDGTTYYYDHWEDGYDADPFFPGATTEVGVLDAGATKVFDSQITIANIGSVLYYDGRDRLTVYGEKPTVVRNVYPENPGVVLGASWDIEEVADWGSRYIATVGEDLEFNPGDADDHDYSSLSIMATLPGTQVYYNGALAATLSPGGTYTKYGDTTGTTGVHSNDVVTATAPIQAQLLTGGCGSANSGNGYTLVPAEEWTNEYWVPVPGFDDGGVCTPSGGAVDSDIYIHNPHDSAIVVTAVSNLGTANLNIPAHATRSLLDYVADGAPNWEDISTDEWGIHLYSANTFWGLGVVDSASTGKSDSQVFDVGYSLIPLSYLSSQIVVGYSPGNSNNPPNNNSNLAFVTAITDTVLYVDLNNDGLPDPFDMNSDGDRLDNDQWGNAAWDEPTSGLGVPMLAGQTMRVGDPNDKNLEGALIYTLDYAHKIAAAWSQDPCFAATGSPALDFGYTIPPLPVATIAKSDGLAVDADLTGDVSPGDIVTYTLLLHNAGLGSMNDVVLTDTLPYTYVDFIPGSLAVSTPPPTLTTEYYDGLAWGSTPIANAHLFRITWDTFGPKQEVTVTFRAQLHLDIPITVTEITNVAYFASPLTGAVASEDPDDPTDPDTDTPVGRAILSINKTAITDTVRPGDLVTFTIAVTNVGTGIALGMTLTDVLPAGLQYVSGTLDLRWPTAELAVMTRTVSQTTFFHGYYADNFDLTLTQTTYYTGSDGNLSWSTDWTEVADDDDPTGGSVRAGTTPANALTPPAYLEAAGGEGVTVGATRSADLALFQSPLLRYYLTGSNNSSDEQHRVRLNGASILTERYNNSAYGIRELDVSAAAGGTAALDFLALNTLDMGEWYRFDNISIHETEPDRIVDTVLEWAKVVLVYHLTTNGDPVSYDSITGQMVISENVRLPAGGVISVTFQARADPSLPNGMILTNTACVTATNWLLYNTVRCDEAAIQARMGNADLSVSKTSAPLPAVPGLPITYTIVVSNAGPVPVGAVTLTDHLPAAVLPPLSYLPSEGSYDSVTGAWTGLALDAGDHVTLRIVGTLDPFFSGALQNTVAITPTGAVEPDPDNNVFTDTNTVQPQAYLDLSKNASPDPALPGGAISYIIVVTNTGPSAQSVITVRDNLPPELTGLPVYTESRGSYASSTGAWSFAPALGPGERVTLTITGLSIAPGATGNVVNVVVVTGTHPTTPTTTFTETTPLVSQADLALRKTSQPDPMMPGEAITYTIVVTNLGPGFVSALTLTDNLPAAVLMPTYSASAGSYDEATGAWTGLALNAGDHVTLRIVGSVAPGFSGVLQNTATVTPTGVTDPTPGNNSSTNTNPSQPVLQASKRDAFADNDGNGIPSPGDTLTYTIVITNRGSTPATNVVFSDIPDANTTLVVGSVQTTQGTVTSGNAAGDTSVAVSVGVIPGGDVVNISFQVTIDNPLPAGVTQITNQGVVSSSELPPVLTDDPSTPPRSDPSITPVTAAPDLSAYKTDALYVDADSNGVPSPGDTLLYQVSIVNDGNAGATGVTFSDTPDANTTLVVGSVQTSQGTVTSGNAVGDTSVAVNVGALPGGSSVTVSFRVTINNPLPAGVTQITNQGLASSNELPPVSTDDPITPGDDEPTTTPVAAAPNLSASKTDVLFVDADGDGVPSPGDTLLYHISIFNDGNAGASGIVFSDIPDANTTLVIGSVQTSQGAVTSGNAAGDTSVAVNVGTIAGGGSMVTIGFRVTINNPLPGGVTHVSNQGVVSSSELPPLSTDDPNTLPANDPSITPVTASPDLAAYKTAVLFVDADSNGAPSPGDALLYQVSIFNNGNAGATGVVFSDTPDPNTALVVGSVQTTQGTVTSGNNWDDTTVAVNAGTIPGGGGSVDISFQVTINNPLPGGVTQITNQGLASSNELPPVSTDDPVTPAVNDPSITPVTAAPELVVSKSDMLYVDADGDGVPSPGDTLLYQVSILNNGNIGATGVVFSDTPDANTTLVVGSVQTTLGAVTRGNAAGDTSVEVNVGALPGRGGVANIGFQITINDPLPGGVTQITNQGWVNSNELPPAPTDDPITPPIGDPSITPVAAVPILTAYKTSVLFADVDGDGVANPGDTLLYQVTILNNGNIGATGVVFSDTLDANTALVVGSVQTTLGVVTLGNAAGDTSVAVNVGALPGGGTVVNIGFRVVINDPLPEGVTQVSNQGVASSNELPPAPTDDPITPGHDEPTITPVTPLCDVADPYEPDNFYSDAVEVVPDGTTLVRAFHMMGDKDWIKFYAQAGRVYTITTLHLDADVDTVLQLYDTDGLTLLVENDDYAPDSEASRIVWMAPADGAYYARVTHFDSNFDPRHSPICGNHYEVMVETALCSVADAYEPDNFYTQAVEVPPEGAALTRTFHMMGDKDWIKFYAAAGRPYTITTSHLSADVDTVLQLYGKDGKTLLFENDDYMTGTEASRIVWTAPADSWYYARTAHFDPDYDPRRALVCGSQYRITVGTELCAAPDLYEPDNFYLNANPIPTNGSGWVHTFHIIGDKDWVKFYTQAGRTYTITTLYLDADVDTVLELYDLDGMTLLAENDNYAAGSSASRIVWTAPQYGWYYARITHADTDYEPRNSSLCGNHFQVAVLAEPQLVVYKTAEDVNGGALYAGDEIWYSVEVVNLLDVPQTNVVITDAIPANATYIPHTAWLTQGSLTGPDPFVANVGTLLAGQSVRLTFRVTVNEGAAGQAAANTAIAGSDQQDPPISSGPVEPQPGGGTIQPGRQALSIGKFAEDVNGGPLYAGEEILYTVAVINLLTTTQTGIVITDAVPAFTTYVPKSARASQGSIAGPDPFVVSVGALEPGEHALFTFRVRVNADAVGQTVANTALGRSDQQIPQVYTGPVEPVPAGGVVLPGQQVLGISKTALDLDGGPPYVGDLISYTIVVVNLSSVSQPGVVITDSIPLYTSYVPGSARVSQGSISGPDPLVAHIGLLPVGGSATLSFLVTVDPGTANQIIANVAQAGNPNQQPPAITPPVEPYPSPLPGDPTSGGGTVASADQQIGIVKVAVDLDGGYLNPFDTVAYTITIWNETPVSQTNVIVTDYIPAYTTYVVGSLVTTQGTASGPDPLLVNVGTLEVGQYVTITFQVVVNERSEGEIIVNQATVSSDLQTPPAYTPPITPPGGGLVVGEVYLPQIFVNYTF